jgi:hypothetical protein
MGGWVDGWMGGWMEVKAVLRIAYSNQQSCWFIKHSLNVLSPYTSCDF